MVCPRSLEMMKNADVDELKFRIARMEKLVERFPEKDWKEDFQKAAIQELKDELQMWKAELEKREA